MTDSHYDEAALERYARETLKVPDQYTLLRPGNGLIWAYPGPTLDQREAHSFRVPGTETLHEVLALFPPGLEEEPALFDGLGLG